MKEKKSELTEESFFQRLLSAVFGTADPEADKRRLLKQQAKKLSKTRFKFYKYNSDEILPSFAKFFYDIYKLIAPAQAIFQSAPNPNIFKQLAIDSILTNKQLELIEMLSEESLTAASQSKSVKELDADIKAALDELNAGFSNTAVEKGDSLYTAITLFKDFCLYDYFFLLKKFNSEIKEKEFSSVPVFSSSRAEYIGNDLIDFISVAWPVLTYGADWKRMMEVFKEARGFEPVPSQSWLKLIARLRQIRDSGTFEMMIRLIKKDPFYAREIKVREEHIIDDFIKKIETEASSALKKIVQAQKASRIESSVQKLFGSGEITPLTGYTGAASQLYERRNYGGFTYHQALNYLKAFLLDYVKKDIRAFSDLVLVRGKWTAVSLSSPMSDAYNVLINLSDSITAFDNAVAPTSPWGNKMKNLVIRADRDKEAAKIIRTQLGDVNAKARKLLIEGTQSLIVYGKNTKLLLDDYSGNTGSLIINWRELEHFTDYPINEMAANVYKSICQFVNLMQNFIGK